MHSRSRLRATPSRIAPALLPHLHQRALTLKRYPNGVDGQFFYEKNCPKHRPEWVQTAPIWSEGNKRTMHYCMAQDLPTLVWAANLADLELHNTYTALVLPRPKLAGPRFGPEHLGIPARWTQDRQKHGTGNRKRKDEQNSEDSKKQKK